MVDEGHVVGVANFYGPRSGGLRTAMNAIGRGYLARGVRSTILVPGERDAMVETVSGTLVTIAAPLVPGAGGYRVVRRLGEVWRLLTELRPDRVELSDRTTLHPVATWAGERGIDCSVIAHERIDGVLGSVGVPGGLARTLADARNRRTVATGASLVATTAFAGAELARVGATVHHVPLGVDLETFTPMPDGVRHRGLELLLCSRLSREKRPELAVDTVRELRRRGVDARLTIAGHGPARRRIERRAADLPVRFLGFISSRSGMREVLGRADLTLAPGPIETFGLAALESLASGTPVIGNAASALPEIIGGDGMAGRCAVGSVRAFADAVESVLAVPPLLRRAAARHRAERFTWDRTLDALQALPSTVPVGASRGVDLGPAPAR